MLKLTNHASVYDIDMSALDDHELRQLGQLINDERLRRDPPNIVLTEPEKCLIAGGHSISAIKLIRERLDPKPGLRQAKDAVDAYKRLLNPAL